VQKLTLRQQQRSLMPLLHLHLLLLPSRLLKRQQLRMLVHPMCLQL
jgi:hypothetical protein